MGRDKHWQNIVKGFNSPIVALFSKLSITSSTEDGLFSSPNETLEGLSCKAQCISTGKVHLLPFEVEGSSHELWIVET